jgi:HTH-type transcriptional regulator / antitoxin HigA
MQPQVINTEADYEAVLARVAELMNAQPGSPKEKELALFALLVEQYEKEHFPIAPPDPVEVLLFRME